MLFFSFLFQIFLFFHVHGQTSKQDSQYDLQDSRNGYILPVNGHIHILVIFAEVIYESGKDPCPPEGTKGWRSGQLPEWKDNLFDPYPSDKPHAVISKFFHEASFGQYVVTGDYLVNPQKPGQPVQIKASGNVTTTQVLKQASEFSAFFTKSNFSMPEFDRWTMTHTGQAKETPSVDSPMRFDHVMIIIRNSTYPTNLSGWTSSRSAGRLFGYETDTYSFFSSHELLPMNILLHEYSHMLFGGNNFHAGGSHSKKAGYSYFPHLQGGWGMMGAAWKSFLTANAWERRQLGWKPPEKKWYISTFDSSGLKEIPADLDAFNSSHEGVFLIRDFVTTGDALRIKLPFFPGNVYQQWLWIENHQTVSFNGSEFDMFQYQQQDCVDKATPGLYMYIQVDKEAMTGKNIYEGYADYLRPLPANGLWDFVWGDTTLQNPWCINNNFYHPHTMPKDRENPFSGSHEMELVFGDYNTNGKIEIDEYRVPAIRKEKGNVFPKLPILGAKEHAFSLRGNNYIGIGTNPSSSGLITAVTSGGELYAGLPPNNRTIFLNGISVEILDKPVPVPGAIFVRIRFDDYTISQNARWCADTIFLQDSEADKPLELTVKNNSVLHIDRGLTPTRILHPDTISQKLVYTQPTVFVIGKNSRLHILPGSTLRITNGSVLMVMEGASLILDKNARLIISDDSRVIFKEGSGFTRHKKAKVKVQKGSWILHYVPSTIP